MNATYCSSCFNPFSFQFHLKIYYPSLKQKSIQHESDERTLIYDPEVTDATGQG